MPDSKEPCEFCEGYVYEHPWMSEGSLIDVYMFIEGATDLKQEWDHLVVEDERTNCMAVFGINYCPMCGRELRHYERECRNS